MKFGVFDHMDNSGVTLGQQIEERLRLIEAYDRGGFYAYHLAEHHGTPLGLAPSPSVFLAAVAQRTKRLRFGPLVYSLPLYHPVRLIEEICMLDQMSGGRFELGVGRGVSPFEAVLDRLLDQRVVQVAGDVVQEAALPFAGGSGGISGAMSPARPACHRCPGRKSLGASDRAS